MEELKEKTTTELTERLKEITILTRNLKAEYRMIAHELYSRIEPPTKEKGKTLELTKKDSDINE